MLFCLPNIPAYMFHMKHSSRGLHSAFPIGEGGTQCRIGVLPVYRDLFVLSTHALSNLGYFRLSHLACIPLQPYPPLTRSPFPMRGRLFSFPPAQYVRLYVSCETFLPRSALCLPHRGRLFSFRLSQNLRRFITYAPLHHYSLLISHKKCGTQGAALFISYLVMPFLLLPELFLLRIPNRNEDSGH